VKVAGRLTELGLGDGLVARGDGLAELANHGAKLRPDRAVGETGFFGLPVALERRRMIGHGTSWEWAKRSLISTLW